jgi:hypothetical protein
MTDESNKLHEAFGEFCIEFEQVCMGMEICISTILSVNGLANDPMIKILLSEKTAEPLRSLLYSLVSEQLKPTEEQKKVLKKCFAGIQGLISLRNEIVHSKWFVVYQATEVGREYAALGKKIKSNASGDNTQSYQYSVQQLKEAVTKCHEAYRITSLFNRCVLGIRTIDECFSIRNRELIVNHAAAKPIEI